MKYSQVKKECKICKKEFSVFFLRRNKAKFCSRTCMGLSLKGNQRGFKKGFIPWSKGKTYSLKHAGSFKIGDTPWNKGTKRPEISGEKHWNWINDRSKVSEYWTKRNNPEYKQWRKKVGLRDNFKCKIGNLDCSGRIEAHHILSWTKYPELRYQLSNGITLCRAHHPRGRENEAKLSPYLRSLVAEMK